MTSKLQVKIFARQDAAVEEYVPVLHRWIRERLLQELLIDVVDYTHVKDGPAVVLIGHESDYVLDRGDGKLGLLYVSKGRDEPLSISQAVARALRVALLLEQEKEPKSRVSFRGDQLSLRVADRLNAPNTDQTYQRLLPELRAALEPLFGVSGAEVIRVGTARELFTVQVRARAPQSFAELCERASVRPTTT